MNGRRCRRTEFLNQFSLRHGFLPVVDKFDHSAMLRVEPVDQAALPDTFGTVVLKGKTAVILAGLPPIVWLALLWVCFLMSVHTYRRVISSRAGFCSSEMVTV